jgi:hypothetical protein
LKEAQVVTTRTRALNLKVIAIALLYVAALMFVANVAFGASVFFVGGSSDRPARTALYAGLPPAAAPIDGSVITPAINEANGGPATIGRAKPADQASSPTTSSATGKVAAITSSTTATATAQTQLTTLSLATVLALIPTITLPARGKSGQHH